LSDILCTIHNHSSDATAKICRAKFVGKRADKRLERYGLVHKTTKYTQVKHDPPTLKVLNGVEIYTYYSAKSK
jgi:hypothetical protein